MLIIMEKSDLINAFLCAFFLMSLLLKSSFKSVVFDFSASLIALTPLSLILFAVDITETEDSELSMGAFCVSSSVFTTQIEFN